MKKHLSAIITSIGIMIGIILLILIQVIGKTNILDILVRCYAFSIPLWITIIVSLKRKEKKSSTAISKKTTTRPTGGLLQGYKPLLLGPRLKALAFSLGYGNSVYTAFPQLRSSHIALNSSLPLKELCYYLALTLKRVLIFFYT